MLLFSPFKLFKPFILFIALFIFLCLVIFASFDEHWHTTPIPTINYGFSMPNKSMQSQILRNSGDIVSKIPMSAVVTPSDACISSGFYDLRTFDGVTNTHEGIDIAPEGSGDYDVLAPQDGILTYYSVQGGVCQVGDESMNYGSYLVLEVQNDQFITRFLHVDQVYFPNNTLVKQGDRIAHIGKGIVGCSTGEHLYYQIRQNTVSGFVVIDPDSYVSYPRCSSVE